MSKRLSTRPRKVYGYSDAKSSTDERVSESESGNDGPPVPIPMQSSCVHKASGRVRQTARMKCASESESGNDGPPVPIPMQSSCVHKASGRVRKTARMKCASESESGNDGPPVPIPMQSSCVHKASGRVRKTARMECEQSSSVSDDEIPLSALPFHLGVMFTAPGYVREKCPQAKNWLLQTFGSYHKGGHVVTCNSRFDYIVAKCCKCEARGAVTFKKPFSDQKWAVTTVKEGADAPCRSALPPPPPLPAHPASPPQKEMTCNVCLEQTSQYIKCALVKPHVICWTCMDVSIEQQCSKEAVEFFFRNRGIACPCCPKSTNSSWRLPFEEVKHKLSAASVQHVAKAERDLIADDAFKAAMLACAPKDHVASTLEWLIDPEKCPTCSMAIEVCDVVSFCVHKRSLGDAAHFRMHSDVLSQM
jgi:hypothetical protein